jgi:acetylglutamate kinase
VSDPIEQLQTKAAILIEALPYIQRFAGETLVVKYGGHAMTDPAAAASFARDVVLLRQVGIKVVVVHGGGPQIEVLLDRLGIVSQRKKGHRVTDDATMQVVRMVLVGQVAQEIVARINQAGGRAVSLSGVDGNLLRGSRMLVDGEDVGRVGRIDAVDDTELRLLTAGGFIPVVTPVAVDSDGEPLNVNADLGASAIAVHLKARKLLLMTDIDGVRGADGKVISTLERRLLPELVATGVVDGGMLPKLECAAEALDGGVEKVHILDGRVRHAVLLELFTSAGIGTEVV